MSLISIAASLAILICIVSGDNLPQYFQKCKRNDPYLNQCVASSANKALPYLAQGDLRYDIPSFSPLRIPFISISSRGIIANLTDATVDGISYLKILNADLDFKGKNFAFMIKTPSIHIMSKYSIYGRFLMIPITANGTANITFEKLNLKFSFTYDLVDFQGEEYMQITNATLIYAFENISLDLENFTSINTTSRTQLDELFSRNTFGINEELGLKIGESIGESIAKILNNFFKKVPFNQLFDD